jgi:hypothetical protein
MNIYRQIWIYIKFSVKLFIEKPGFTTLKTTIRFFPAWKTHLADGKSSVTDNIPWLTFPSIHFLNKNINNQMIVFEYGSGGSTLFWSGKTKEVVSVEHDGAWYTKIKKELEVREIKNVSYFLFEAEPDPGYELKSPDNPSDYISEDENAAGKKFERYVKKIDEYPDQYFDIILIDGRARPSCIAHGMKKLKPQGYLVIDNSERAYYFKRFGFSKSQWERKDFPGPSPYSYHFSQTTFLKKL